MGAETQGGARKIAPTSLGLPTVLTGPGDAPASLEAAAARFPDEIRERAREILDRFPPDRSRSALLPMLHLVQSHEGFVSPDGIGFCAAMLGLTRAEVAAVATFYTMYKREPTGDYLVSVCTNTMCDSLGGQRVFDQLAEDLGVGHNETTADGTITLEHAECLAACDFGPVLTVNYEFYDKVTVDSAQDLVRALQSGERPAPSRGSRLCTFKEISRELAGFDDLGSATGGAGAEDRSGAIADGVAGDATLAGLKLAQANGVAAPQYDPTTPIVPEKEAGRA
jgi:NADH-quinone oxidoreductase subunit E